MTSKQKALSLHGYFNVQAALIFQTRKRVFGKSALFLGLALFYRQSSSRLISAPLTCTSIQVPGASALFPANFHDNSRHWLLPDYREWRRVGQGFFLILKTERERERNCDNVSLKSYYEIARKCMQSNIFQRLCNLLSISWDVNFIKYLSAFTQQFELSY